MQCKKCGKTLVGKQTSYCSSRCSKYHLKSLYKLRNKDKILEYNREYRNKRRLEVRIDRIAKNVVIGVLGKCYYCNRTDDLVFHHMSYTPEKYVQLCKECHIRHHKMLKGTNLVIK